MKYLFLLLLSTNCYAAEYRFTFRVPDGKMVSTLKYKIEAKDQYEALYKAGLFCGNFFGIGSRKLTDDQAMDIIDACANPSVN